MPKSGEQPSVTRRSSTGRKAGGAAGRGARSETSGGRARSAATDGVDAPAGGLENGKGGRGAGSVRPMIEIDFLRALIAVVDESGIDSLEIARAGTRIRISKSPAVVAGPAVAAPVAPVPAPVIAAQAGGATAPSGPGAAEAAPAVPAAPAPEPAPAPARELVEVKSPMVGTFYAAPAPEAPPYVEVGSTVTKGQTLCILEAMKLMNELESEVDGIVREILVENAEPVEYGQVLFRIEPIGTRS
ncbi:MAG TPA: acetyl-CoA carboxylase biotin carboxyl carrier protein [Longimicrobiales bacterium]